MPLTPQEESFAQKVAAGENPLDAAKAIFWNGSPDKETMERIAAEQWAKQQVQKPRVKRRVMKVYEELESMGMDVGSTSRSIFTEFNKPRRKFGDKIKVWQTVLDHAEKLNEVDKQIDPILILIRERESRGLPIPDEIKNAAIEIERMRTESATDVVGTFDPPPPQSDHG
mgnify:FL=1